MSTVPALPVVVGVDGSESALAAAAWAARYAGRAQVPLRVVHAFGWPLVRVSSGPSRWTRGLRAEAWGFVEEARDRAYAVDPDLDVSVSVRTSFAAPLLLRESESASLVVVGTHGLGGFSGLVIGSTGVELAARSCAPVVVRRGRPADEIGAETPVLVGYDGSRVSDLAVAAGVDYAVLLGRPVELLHVSRFGGGDGQIAERMFDLAETWQRVHPDVKVGGRVVSGHPGGALTEATRDTALLVVGSRGRGGFRGLALGSVSQTMLHHAHCPVMALPPALVARGGRVTPAGV